MAKYFQEPPSLAQFETARKPSRLPRPTLPDPLPQAPAPLDPPTPAPRKKGIRERSQAESWARGLMLMGAGLGLFAVLNTASALLLGTGLARPLFSWSGAVLVILAGRQASAALLADPPSPEPFYRHGGALMAAGVALVFLGPWLLTLVS